MNDALLDALEEILYPLDQYRDTPWNGGDVCEAVAALFAQYRPDAHLRQPVEDDEPALIDFDAVVAGLAALGIPAFVQQTGGGVATIYAGTVTGDRYQALAGPGWFTGPGWTLAKGYAGEFSVSSDDDGEGPYTETGIADPAALAAVIAAYVNSTN